ncbi:MAG: hypothetical protein LBH22_08795 [Bacteroidales bacterium]|jgi:hypothetical protein|nr:hypothetical protein [Bacteroidales bacterium]
MQASIEFDYYMIGSTGEPNVPLLMNNDDYDVRGIRFLSFDEHVDIDKPVYLALNPPVPPKPNLSVDYLTLPDAVFSQKIADALLPLNIEGYQLVPAIIVDKKREEHKNFWIGHAFTTFECFDKEESIYDICPFTEEWDDIEKLVMSNQLLEKTPLEKRLIFTSKETSRFIFYHKTIVDAIMSVNPLNIRFTSVENWFEGVQFI